MKKKAVKSSKVVPVFLDFKRFGLGSFAKKPLFDLTSGKSERRRGGEVSCEIKKEK